MYVGVCVCACVCVMGPPIQHISTHSWADDHAVAFAWLSACTSTRDLFIYLCRCMQPFISTCLNQL